MTSLAISAAHHHASSSQGLTITVSWPNLIFGDLLVMALSLTMSKKTGNNIWDGLYYGFSFLWGVFATMWNMMTAPKFMWDGTLTPRWLFEWFYVFAIIPQAAFLMFWMCVPVMVKGILLVLYGYLKGDQKNMDTEK